MRKTTSTTEMKVTVRDFGKERRVLVTVDPERGIITLRLKGTRRSYPILAPWLYWQAVQLSCAAKSPAKSPPSGDVRRGTLNL